MSGKPTELGGYQQDRGIDTLRQDLLIDHWKHKYNWAGLSIGTLAERYNCSMDDVRRIMMQIATEHPKPKLNPREGTCKSCGAPIVWIGKHPCDPPVLKVVTADGKIHSARGSHFATCPDADKWRKK